MIKKARLLLIIIVSLVMYGCGSESQTSYSYLPPDTAEGHVCVAQCGHSKTLCEQTCSANTNNSDCVAQAKEQGRFKYNEYLSRRQALGKPVERDLNSFIDTQQCRSLSCKCDADYNACYQLCGGKLMHGAS